MRSRRMCSSLQRYRLPMALVGCLVVLAGGCERAATTGLPMPKRIVDLSPAITPDLAIKQLGHRASEFLGLKKQIPFTPVVPENAGHTFGLTSFELVSHLGSHLDAPGRLVRDGERADQVPLDKLYGKAQVIDLRWKDRHSPIQITDLENYAIEAGQILILYVGYKHPQGDEWPTYAPISLQAAEWLTSKGIKALATDMPSIGSFSRYAELMDKNRPINEVWAERLAFTQAGIPVIEGLTNLGELLDKDKVVFVGFPLAIADRSGAPLRAAALLY